jgi:hypothetical protein
VAERACRAVLEYRHRDRSNQLGDEPGSTGGPYSDWTGYEPVNDADLVRDPDRWQPRPTPDGRGGTSVQQFTTPHWGEVLPFAPGDADLVRVDPGPPRTGTPVRQAEIDEMVRLSAELTDEQKVIAEYWVDGPGMEAPPGHWMIFGQLCSRRDAHGLDFDVKLFFVLANALHDAGIATWARKRHFDSIRPVSLVPLTYAGRKVRSWGGPSCRHLPSGSTRRVTAASARPAPKHSGSSPAATTSAPRSWFRPVPPSSSPAPCRPTTWCCTGRPSPKRPTRRASPVASGASTSRPATSTRVLSAARSRPG